MKKITLFCTFFLAFISCEVVFVENISNKKVDIIAPANNVKVQKGVVKFNWNPIESATSYKFQVAVPSFKNTSQIIVDTTITSTSFSQELSTGSYQWQVKAINEEYETSYTTNSFTIN